MFRSFSNSWQLLKATWAILRKDKELALYPLISSGVLTVVTVIIGILGILILGIDIGSVGQAESNAFGDVLSYVVLFIIYLVDALIASYFTAALVGAAMIRIDGGDPTFQDGIRIANENFRNLLSWAVISATVGAILRTIASDDSFLGRIVASLIGAAWNIATFLVIPVLVEEQTSGIDSVKRSTSLLRNTWGVQIIGNIGLGWAAALIVLLTLFVGIGLFVLLLRLELAVIAIGVLFLMVLALIVISMIFSTLDGIYRAAVYRYAVGGTVPDDFDIELIQGAFRDKQKRSG